MPVPPPSAGPDVKPVIESSAGIQLTGIHSNPPAVIAPVPPPINGLLSIKEEDICGNQPTIKVEEDDAVLQLAKMVSQCGDDIEDIIKARNTDDIKLWFLHQKDSSAYLQYRLLVEKLRREKNRSEGCKSEGHNFSEREGLSKSLPQRNSPTFGKEIAHFGSNENGQNINPLAGSSQGDNDNSSAARKRKRRSRWAPEDSKSDAPSLAISSLPPTNVPPPGYQGISAPGGAGIGSGPVLSRVTRTDPGLLRYAMQSFGTTNLTEEDWKKAEDHYKINLLYQDLLKKREDIKKLEMRGKHKYEYDSDEECEGGTWEHKLRSAEMEATERWADELTRQSQGKHHIGDFLPPEELSKFMEKYTALKDDREPDLSDYKEFKLREDNIGFQMLQKLGWSEGQGLGSDGTGIVDPVGRANQRTENQGLGVDRPDEVSKDDDEFDAYRKRMMLAYRFRPNPLNNPRRPYY